MTSEAPELLDPPTFQLATSSEYELWSLRMPVKFDPTSLDGVSLYFDNDMLEDQSEAKASGVGGSGGAIPQHQQDNVMASFELSNDSTNRHSLAVGNISETQSFRVLAPANPSADGDDGDSDDDDKNDKKKMNFLSVPFTKHVNLIQSSKTEMTELELAPSKERAPKAEKTLAVMTGSSSEKAGLNMAVREAYSHIDQVKGLKKRWSMFGSNVDVDELRLRQKRRRESSNADVRGSAVAVADKIGNQGQQQQQQQVEIAANVDGSDDDSNDKVISTVVTDETGTPSSRKKVKKEKKEKKKKSERKKSRKSSKTSKSS